MKKLAVVHDTVEDTDVTLALLKVEGFPEYIVDAVDAITKREGEALEVYLMRVKANPLAREVKLRDIEDNSNIHRLHAVEEKHLKMIQKYHKAYLILSQ